MDERQRGETKAEKKSLLGWGERLAGARSLEEVFRW